MRELEMDIGVLCEHAHVSRSGYYRWLKHADDPDRDHDDSVVIKAIFEKGKRKLGFRAIQMRLKDKLIVMNHKKIQRIMRKYQLFTKIRRINPYRMIMKKSLEHRTAPNLLARDFKQSTPYKVLCTDITYLWFNYRMAYLSVIKDIASGEIVAWKLSRHMEMSIVLDTIEYMQHNANLATPSWQDAMIHSDQGVHYTHPSYIAKVQELNMVQSMSRKGNCIDNAPIESFFGHLKDDIDYKSCKTFNELDMTVNEYMQYYNNERHQWGLKKMTPVAYRDHLLATAQ